MKFDHNLVSIVSCSKVCCTWLESGCNVLISCCTGVKTTAIFSLPSIPSLFTSAWRREKHSDRACRNSGLFNTKTSGFKMELERLIMVMIPTIRSVITPRPPGQRSGNWQRPKEARREQKWRTQIVRFLSSVGFGMLLDFAVVKRYFSFEPFSIYLCYMHKWWTENSRGMTSKTMQPF